MQKRDDFLYKTRRPIILFSFAWICFVCVIVLLILNNSSVINTARELETVRIESSRIPLALGLVFHDAMDGLDGCININAAENQNIVKLVDALDIEFPNMTRVDKWVMVGNNAVRAIITNLSEKRRLVYGTGRFQAYECNTNTQLESEANWAHFVRMFRRYEMTEAEMVALMAVHGLFGAHTGVSGYSGQWVIDPPPVITSEYYRYLRDFTYQKTVKANKTQFRRVTKEGLNNEYLMLSSEITMYYDSARDVVSPACPKNSLFATYVEDFAQNSQLLETTFVTAWNKMTRIPHPRT